MLISWNDIDIALDDLGGKGKNLAYLTANQLPVPPWYCIPAQLFKHYSNITEYNEIESIKQRLYKPEVLEKIQQELQEIAHSKDDVFYAVRSSANCEDSSSHSFAGLFDTYLYVPRSELAQYVLKCWLSVFTVNVLSYLKKNNISLHNIGLSVIIQEMVDSQQSGIMFQANPAGPIEQTVIVAGYGLGEGIVTDQVETDTFYFDRLTKETTKNISEKLSFYQFDKQQSKGIIKNNLPEHLKNTPVLSEEQLGTLLELSNKISSCYSEFQDIEWAFDQSGKLFLLQSRPITTIPAGDLCLYDNSNVTESYPGISLPLTTSIVKKIYDRLFYHAFAKNGGITSLLNQYRANFENMVECIEGRIYYNLSNWYQVMSLMPFASKLFIPALEDAIGSSRANHSNIKRKFNIHFSWQKLRFFITLIHRYISLGNLVKKHDDKFKLLYKKTQRKLKTANSSEDIRTIYKEFMHKVFPIDQLGRVSDTYLTVFLITLTKCLKYYGLDTNSAANLINGLLAGQDDLDSVLPVKSIKQFAEEVSNTPKLLLLLQQSNNWQILQTELKQKYPIFLEKINNHIQLYGDRTIGELKFETETFRQSPLKLIQVIINYAELDTNPIMENSNEQILKENAEKTLKELIGNKVLGRLAIYYLLNKVRFFIKNREKFRLNRSRYYGLIREMILCIAEQWVLQGLLKKSSDVFYLTDEEVFNDDSQLTPEYLGCQIARNKQQWEIYQQKKPVNRMWLKGNVVENFIPQEKLDTNSTFISNNEFYGIGCCPGEITGKAIVLHEPDATINVKGKILVAENTDPGWVFLIMGASALVVEKGSLLSHTAIIGRELGIPTVVGVKQATHRIPSGTSIFVDGGIGKVVIN